MVSYGDIAVLFLLSCMSVYLCKFAPMNIVYGISMIVMMLCSLSISGQKMSTDSVWCDHLNEIVKCVSLDKISERLGYEQTDADLILPYTPSLTLNDHLQESICKHYGKVSYTAICFTSSRCDKKLLIEYEKWYLKFRECLDLWDTARLKNEDENLAAYQDYFMTNGEDETAVRIDIAHTDKGYGVRIRIF